MTYTLTLTPYHAALLDAACRAAGLDTLNIFPAVLNRTPTTPPAAVLPTQPRPSAPMAEERTRLIRPGMTIPAGDVDPEDESLYI